MSDEDTDSEPFDASEEFDIDIDSEESGADLPPQEVDRVFSVMEQAIESDSLEGHQLERFLSVLEGAFATPSETSPETVAELISILEELVVDTDDIDDIGGVLSILEETVAGATAADEEGLDEVFEVLGEGITDPTGLDPEDIERFRSGIESAIVDLTDPNAGSLGPLFAFPGTAGTAADAADVDEEALDMFRIARVAAGMTQRATGYSMETGIRTGTRMAYAAATSESPAELLTETRAITLDELQRAGIGIGEEQTDWLEAHEDEVPGRRPLTKEAVRERGERLLSKSAEVGRNEAVHPAYPSILDELAGDEARILRLLATEGTQACMNVRDKRYVPFKSHLIAEHLSMVGGDAGCRHPERTPIYLQNLERLGLITFSDEPIDDLKRYQVLEAQPHIEKAREAANRPKTVYVSLYLTDLGIDFCETCLPVDIEFTRAQTRFRGDVE
ncbi:MAG: hypothetical protein ACI8UR_001132 [Natronomonas sp.]|jgi:hypothetical protein|uniref:DUF4393 domain-containing protein n=1 Tax=Natronomonas sp. TaxID=2184060 RepID=UPI003989E1DC